MVDSIQDIEITRVERGQTSRDDDRVAVEEPLEIQVASAAVDGAAAKSISITMRTPGHDRDLALGFLLTEGLIHRAGDVIAVEQLGEIDSETGLKNRIRVQLDDALELDLARLERHFYTTSSCGVCGKASIDALELAVQALAAPDSLVFRADVLQELADNFHRQQHVFRATGGLHAATAFGPDGEMLVVREDVGRHNATDKVVGALLADGKLPASRLGMLVSGRASFELVQKTLAAGMPLLAAVGAPSSLAAKTARAYGMTLVGFLRDARFNIYSGEQRIV